MRQYVIGGENDWRKNKVLLPLSLYYHYPCLMFGWFIFYVSVKESNAFGSYMVRSNDDVDGDTFSLHSKKRICEVIPFASGLNYGSERMPLIDVVINFLNLFGSH